MMSHDDSLARCDMFTYCVLPGPLPLAVNQLAHDYHSTYSLSALDQGKPFENEHQNLAKVWSG